MAFAQAGFAVLYVHNADAAPAGNDEKQAKKWAEGGSMKPQMRPGTRPPRPEVEPHAGARSGDGRREWRNSIASFVTGAMVVAAFGSILMAVQKIESAFEYNVATVSGPVAVPQPLQNGMAGQSDRSRTGEPK